MHNFTRRSAIHRLVLLAVATKLTAASPALAVDQPALAIKGYDPVAYFTVGRPVEGLPKFAYEWDELQYRFSSERNRQLFKVNPVHYAPQFANYCAMSLTRGELHEADPKNWLISDGKLYIFGESFGPDRFRKNLDQNIAKANHNRSLISKQ